MKRVGNQYFSSSPSLSWFSLMSPYLGYMANGDNTITYIKGASDIRWGIDINGGVEATFSPDQKV